MKLFFYSGLVLFIGALFLLKSNYPSINVQKNGSLVKMEIKKMPSSCLGTRIKHYATFSYNGTSFIKMIPSGYCDRHQVGELVDMKYLPDESVILFPDESAIRQLIAFGVLAFLGAILAIYALAKK